MKQFARVWKERKSLPVSAALTFATLVGCVGEVEDGFGEAEPAESQASALEPEWTFCARVGGECEFEGTRTVRFGRRGRWIERTFTDGVECTPSAFGASRRSSYWSVCQFDASEPEEFPQPEPWPEPEPEPTPEPEPEPTPEPEPPHEHDPEEPMPMPGMGSMPYINLDAIPTGWTGSSRVQIASTSERPGGSDTGDFRTVCGFSHMNFDDPIVFPGQVGASHLHMYFGNTGANAHSTTESLRTGGNSTCRGGIANRTAYWAPALIDAKGTPQAPEDIDIYYKTGYSVESEDIQPFPAGLRMLAGDPKATGRQPHAWWTCEGGGQSASIPNCSPGTRVTMHIQFPQCWDGKNLDSADHRSHMAYPGSDGCPASHPVAIPVITYNIPYRVPSSGTAGWRLASDMYDSSLPGGMSAHADWFAAWEPEVVEAFVRNCNNKSVNCHSHLLGDGRMIY